MPIRPQDINRFVRQEGEPVLHSVGTRCWCTGRDGQLDPNCEAHDVTGSVYGEPERLVGLFSDVMQRKELVATGLFIPGDALFSPLSNTVVAEGDKVTLQKPVPYGSGDARVRGNGDSDPLLYSAVSAMFCMDENRVRYYEKVDFIFQDKTIVWHWEGKAGGAEPAFQTRYTVKYKAFIDFIAFLPPMERFSHGKDIGNKVFLRKLHIIMAQG